jgi:biopolymer transport protein ExbB/TolQ
MSGITFDTSISVGQIVQLLMLIGLIVSFYSRLTQTLAVFEINYQNAIKRLDKIDIDMEKLTKIAEILASQGARIDMLDRRYDDIFKDLRERFKDFLSKAEIQNMIWAAIDTARAERQAKDRDHQFKPQS